MKKYTKGHQSKSTTFGNYGEKHLSKNLCVLLEL